MEIDPRKLPDMPELMIAGPGELHEEDLEIMGRQVIAHYGDLWTKLHEQTIGQLARILGCRDLPYLIPGTGTACLDAAVANLFEAGQRVVVAQTGFFGTRLTQIAHAHGLDVIDLEVEVGAPIDATRVFEAAQKADGVLTVHVETATGVRHSIEEIARAASDAGAVYVVDGIASVGGEYLKVDQWGIDAVVTGTQKGLEAPPGYGILALSPGGRARLDARESRPAAFYLDLKTWDQYRDDWGAWHPHPVTMPTNLTLALGSSMARILEEGLETWIDRRHALAMRCREGLAALGLEPIPARGFGANLVVAHWADDPALIQKHLLAKGIMISGGLDPTMGKAIRVGLMGRTATDAMVDRMLDGVKEALST
ncbi:MAG: aminotransferase class V-fold PLP-dependent enzyme [Actinobacteria bacterium]|nr:aminotransferase class V-fold PLP-dependent enzyme [Actinomycetota bacterium]